MLATLVDLFGDNITQLKILVGTYSIVFLSFTLCNGASECCERWKHSGMLDVYSISPCYPYCPTCQSVLFRSLHFISSTTANQHNPPHSSTPGYKYSQAELACPLVDAGSLDMLCLNFIWLMYTHASTRNYKPYSTKASTRTANKIRCVFVQLRLRSAYR